MLQERTATRKVDRRIVVITDGQSRIQTADGLDDVVKGVRVLCSVSCVERCVAWMN